MDKIADLRPDVIHVHGFGTVGALGTWIARRLDIPMLLTWHTDFDAYADHYSAVLPLLTGVVKAFARLTKGEVLDSHDLRLAEVRYEDRGRSTALLLGLCQKMLETADLVTTPSPKTADRCRLISTNANIRVVPNGVDPLPPGPAPFEHPDGPLVLYAGRIAPEKGIPLLVDAFTLVHAQRPDARLCVVGDWERYSHIRKVLAAGRDAGRIILPGEQKRDALGAYYGMADVFAFPSLTDTQALVLHEAALAGMPIVSVDHELQLVIEPGVNGEITRPTAASLAAGLPARDRPARRRGLDAQRVAPLRAAGVAVDDRVPGAGDAADLRRGRGGRADPALIAQAVSLLGRSARREGRTRPRPAGATRGGRPARRTDPRPRRTPHG